MLAEQLVSVGSAVPHNLSLGVDGASRSIMPRSSLLIGITVTPDNASSENIWANGISQNVLYLSKLLRRLSFTHPVFVVSGDLFTGGSIDGLEVIPASAAVDRLDMLIEIGVRLGSDLMCRFRERGGKLISYMAGNALVMNFECLANGTDFGEIPAKSGFDAVWLTPQHSHMNTSYSALTRSPHVHEAPHIWHPSCLEQAIDQFGANDFFWKDRDGENEWKIGVFDPTINVVKTFHLPLLVCEEAERRNPDLISRVLLFAAQRFIGNPHFEELVAALDLGRNNKVFAEARHALPTVLGAHVEAVVTHQWENSLNYLYWDVLYSGRPLIHNVSAFADAGYYYADFDPSDGGRILADALTGHHKRRADLRDRELELLWSFSIDNPAVQLRYAELILAAMETSS